MTMDVEVESNEAGGACYLAEFATRPVWVKLNLAHEPRLQPDGMAVMVSGRANDVSLIYFSLHMRSLSHEH